LRLLAELEGRIAGEESPFRAQLLREDAARLRKLTQIARTASDAQAFAAAGRRLGWTQGDSRTAELAPVLDPFLEAVYACEREACGEEGERRVRAAWIELTRARVEKLVGCLSTPVPRPGAG